MNNPFGGPFDFNGDGKVDPSEEILGLHILGFFDNPSDGGEDDDEDDEDDDE